MSNTDQTQSGFQATRKPLRFEWNEICQKECLSTNYRSSLRTRRFEDWVLGKLAEMQTDIEALKAAETAKTLKTPPF